MKASSSSRWVMGVLLSLLPFAGGCLQQSAVPLEQPAVTKSEMPAEQGSLAEAPTSGGSGELIPTSLQAAEDEEKPSEAPVAVISTNKPMPTSLRAAGPVSEVVKLAESGVDESVLLSFVKNSTSTFNLGAEEIIYLNDIGVPSSVVTAMIQRDQALAALSRNATTAAAAAPAPAPVTEAARNPVPAAPAGSPELTPETYPAPPLEVSDASFDAALAPYGNWIEVDGYGRCWQPTVAVVNTGWQPYFDGGRWVYTDCGWYWLSDYSWGWAPFHYGRWFRNQNLGWCWAPDHIWGPSWVCWRYSNDFCGWAPLPPFATYNPGAGLCYRGQAVGFNFSFGLGVDCFAFVPFRNFRDHHLNTHAVPRHDMVRVYNQTVMETRIINHNRTVINHGIAPERVAAATRSEVRKVAIHEVTTPSAWRGTRPERLNKDGTSLTVYRPPVPASTRSSDSRAIAHRSELHPSSSYEQSNNGRQTQLTSPPEHLSSEPSRRNPQTAYNSRPISPLPAYNDGNRRPLTSTLPESDGRPSWTGRSHLPSESTRYQTQPSAPPRMESSVSTRQANNANLRNSSGPAGNNRSQMNPNWQSPVARENTPNQVAPSQNWNNRPPTPVNRPLAQPGPQTPSWMRESPHHSQPQVSGPVQTTPRNYSTPTYQHSVPTAHSYSQPVTPSFSTPSQPVRSAPAAPAPSSPHSYSPTSPGRSNPRQ